MPSKTIAEKLSKALDDDDECVRVEELIANGVDVNEADAKGTAPLQQFAKSGCMRCLTLLLEHGAEIEATDADDVSALYNAAKHGKLEAMQFLCDRGVSVFAVARMRWLPLHSACRGGHVNVARVLLEKCPNTINLTTLKMLKKCGHYTPLHLAAESDNVDCIELLLQHRASIEAATSVGRTPLRIAVANGHLPAVKCLLAKGARATATDDEDSLPLHDACSNGHVNIARFLLQKHPDTVNCTTSEWASVSSEVSV